MHVGGGAAVCIIRRERECVCVGVCVRAHEKARENERQYGESINKTVCADECKKLTSVLRTVKQPYKEY